MSSHSEFHLPPENTLLIEAIHNEDYDLFLSLLQKEDVNGRGINGTTPLIEACYGFSSDIRKQMFQDLLAHPKMNVNLEDNFGVTALGVAVAYFPFLAPALLAANADPNHYVPIRLGGGIDPEGKNYNRWRKITPLAVAVRRRNMKLAKLLLEYKADINKIGDLDISPLSLAARENDVLFVKFLIKNGAKIEKLPTNWKEYSADPKECCSVVLRKTLKYNSDKCLAYLLHQGIKIPDRIYRQNGEYATPLTYMLSYRFNYESLEVSNCALRLLSLGKHIHQSDDGKYTYHPLDIEATDSKGRNALYYAIQAKASYDLLEKLMTSRTVNQKDYKDQSPFQIAVWRNWDTIIRQMLEKGANPNEEIFYCPQNYGKLNAKHISEPVIFFALRTGRISIATQLVKHGANLISPNKEGKTPADYVKSCFPEEFQKLFQQHLRYQQSYLKQTPEDLRLERMAKAYLQKRSEHTRG